MKRFLVGFFIYLLITFNTCAQAKTIMAEAMENFNSLNPSKEFSVKVKEGVIFDNGTILEKNSVISGEIKKIIPPKRLKQDAYFVWQAKNYTVPSENDQTITIKNHSEIEIEIKPYEPPNKSEIAGKAAIGIAGIMVKGLSTGIDFTKGVINPIEGENRLKSGIYNAYENSPLSYGSKGEDLFLEKGVLVKFSLDEKYF